MAMSSNRSPLPHWTRSSARYSKNFSKREHDLNTKNNDLGNASDAAQAGGESCQHEEVLARIGQMTRSLHDSLRALGLDKMLLQAAEEIPNARDRLAYVARMTE